MRQFSILLVEDSKHDVLIARRAWRVNRISNKLHIVPHGQACLDFLRNEGKYRDREQFSRPGIILMDIRMPVMGGIECLQLIKSDPELKQIPVVMLTTSKEDTDRVRSYKLGCNTFIQKPVDFDKMVKAMKAIHLYWGLAELP